MDEVLSDSAYTEHMESWTPQGYPVWDNAKLADYYTTTSLRDLESVSADILYAHMPLIRSR